MSKANSINLPLKHSDRIHAAGDITTLPGRLLGIISIQSRSLLSKDYCVTYLIKMPKVKNKAVSVSEQQRTTSDNLEEMGENCLSYDAIHR